MSVINLMAKTVTILLFISVITFWSCKESVHPTVDIFTEMQAHQQQLEFNKLENYFNAKSIDFTNELGNAKDTSDLLRLGKAHKINYFMAEYYRWNRQFETDFNQVIKFFNLLQFSFFDLKYQFRPLQDKAKNNNDEYHLPIAYRFYGENRIRWLKFTKEDNDNYKYDLIYTLQLEDNKYKKRYETNVEDLEKTEKFKALYTILPEIKTTSEEEILTFDKLNNERIKQQGEGNIK